MTAALAVIMKIPKIAIYLRNDMTDLYEIWHDDAKWLS